jgi:hypothetical protein
MAGFMFLARYGFKVPQKHTVIPDLFRDPRTLRDRNVQRSALLSLTLVFMDPGLRRDDDYVLSHFNVAILTSLWNPSEVIVEFAKHQTHSLLIGEKFFYFPTTHSNFIKMVR